MSATLLIVTDIAVMECCTVVQCCVLYFTGLRQLMQQQLGGSTTRVLDLCAATLKNVMMHTLKKRKILLVK